MIWNPPSRADSFFMGDIFSGYDFKEKNMVCVTHFMIHPNNGTPKFWALLDDGSCIFGSMVKKGIKTSANGGDPGEKRGKGYVEIPIVPRCPDDAVIELAALSTGNLTPHLRNKNLKPFVDKLALECLLQVINLRLPIDFSGTRLPLLNGQGHFPLSNGQGHFEAVAPQPDTHQTAGKRKMKEIPAIFTKDFDSSKQEFSF